MASIPLPFPTDRQRIRYQVEDEQDLTPDQRLAALRDILHTAVLLNPMDDVFGSTDSIWQNNEAEWQRSQRELFRRYHASHERRGSAAAGHV